MNRLREQKAMINGTQGAVLVIAYLVGGWTLAGLCFAVMWGYPAIIIAVAWWLIRRRERQEAEA